MLLAVLEGGAVQSVAAPMMLLFRLALLSLAVQATLESIKCILNAFALSASGK